MKLFKLTQKENTSYDTFTTLIVSAETAEEAKLVHPYGKWPANAYQLGWRSWATKPDNVVAEYLGEARDGMPGGEHICHSYRGS